jgi:aryl-alcohol dehydrogenase-like predicted oxidoreductase
MEVSVMELRRLGASDVSVSVIGFGGYELLGDDSDVSTARAAIEAAIDTGVNWIDTAEAYSDTGNERVIGAALEGMRDDILISSKVSPDKGIDPKRIHEACRASLDRLRTDRIDVYFIHWPPEDDDVPLEESWSAMDELVDAGLVRAIGLSNYIMGDIEQAHALRRVDVVQQGMSMIDHLDERPVVARCGELDIGAVIYEPYGSGIITSKIEADTDPRALWGDDIVEWDGYERLLAPGKLERSLAVVEPMREVADRLGDPVGHVAVGWVLAQPGVTSAICGSTNADHIRENSEAAEIKLDDETLEELEALIPLGPTFSAT